jgi:hypothetical protein
MYKKQATEENVQLKGYSNRGAAALCPDQHSWLAAQTVLLGGGLKLKRQDEWTFLSRAS